MSLQRLAVLVLGFATSFIALAAPPPADELKKLPGAKVTERQGVVVELTADAKDFTPEQFALVGRCVTLKKLSLSGKAVNDQALPLLAGLKDLEELSTNGSQLTDDGYKQFAAFGNLRSLALWHPSGNDKGFTGAGLAHLNDLPKLERLTFAGAAVGDAAFEAIGRLTRLRDLSTWHTMQSPAGTAAALARLTNLRSLRIGQRLPRGNPPSPASLDGSTIAAIAKLPALENLEVMEAVLGGGELLPLKDVKTLKSLKIHDADVSAEDVARLRAAMPSVKIDYKPMTDEQRAAMRQKLKVGIGK
jgi:hypothetical protein